MSAAAACLALATPLLAPALDPVAEVAPGCVQVGAEVAGRLVQTWPEGGIDRAFLLPRSRFDLGLERGGAGARLALGGVRSGGADSYIGVAGESIVPQVQIAEARFRWAPWGLALAAGLVDDPWVVTGNAAWDLRAVAPGVGEEQGWLERSDLGGVLAWTSPGAWVSVAGVLSSGEGLARRERNNGQDTAGLLVVRPLAGAAHADWLQVQVYGRDGSRGLGLARDHRAGARLGHRSAWAAGGLEGLRAWGVQGDARRAPVAWSAFAQLTPPTAPVVAFGRFDHVDEDPEAPATDLGRLRLGAGLELPPDAAGVAPMRLLVGWEQTRRDAAITGLAGAAAQREASALYLQLDLRVRESLGETRPVPFP